MAVCLIQCLCYTIYHSGDSLYYWFLACWQQLQKILSHSLLSHSSPSSLSPSLPLSLTSARVCYERVSFMPLATTWAFSALWHGLYPGYYLFFGTMSLGTLAGRKVRWFCRHRFQSPPRVKLAYDIVTWLGATLVRDFAASAFYLLVMDKTFQLWK